jgi:hypothetical protein
MIDQITDPFPAPVAPATSRWEPATCTVQGSPSSRRPDLEVPQGRALRDGEGRDDSREGVAELEHEHDPAGAGAFDPARPGPERVGEVIGAVGVVAGVLPGEEADGDPVTPAVRPHPHQLRHVAGDGPPFDLGQVVGERVGVPVGVPEPGHRHGLPPPEPVHAGAPPRPQKAPIERVTVPAPPQNTGCHSGDHDGDRDTGASDRVGHHGGGDGEREARVPSRPPGRERDSDGEGADGHEGGRDHVVIEGAGRGVGHADTSIRGVGRTGADGLDALTAPVHTPDC